LRSTALACIVPHTREVPRELDNALARGLIQQRLVGLLLVLLVSLQGIELAQSLVPLGLQRVGHQPVVGIYLGIAASGQLGFIAGTL
jgi:hypothetical protein